MKENCPNCFNKKTNDQKRYADKQKQVDLKIKPKAN